MYLLPYISQILISYSSSNDTLYVSKSTIFNFVIPILNFLNSFSIEHGEQCTVRWSTSRRTASLAVQDSVPPARQPVAGPRRGHRGHDEEFA